jgi:acetyl esterase/lipase
MNSFFNIAAMVLAGISALLSIPLFLRLRWPAVALWFLKLYVAALSPLLAFVGILSLLTGLITGAPFTIIIGLYVVVVFLTYIFGVTRSARYPANFEKAFGPDWESRIHPAQKKFFLPLRYTLLLPAVPRPRLEKDIPFATIPGSSRQLLCDIWQPPAGVSSTGLAFIYLHGSAFYLLDKDCGTRPFFRHLAAQGHVIMDVAYRLSPETGLMGMINDVKRAILWMKEHADVYNIDPGCIVIGGGSAGGHLALMAAYTANNSRFTATELIGKDDKVSAVISLYGTNDLKTLYYHTNQHLTTRSVPGRARKTVPTKMPGWIIKRLGENFHRLGFDKGFENAGALAPLLGGHPDECPETYAFFSPLTHVHRGCPPTLLIHGEDDIMAPVKTTRMLYTRLADNGVPAILHILPRTDHGFDLVLPKISPPAHSEFYDVERFLALHTPKSRVLKSTPAKAVPGGRYLLNE